MSLRERLTRPGILVAPGCYDALTASLVEEAGFEAAYVSGAGIAYTRLGRPDIGLVSMAEVADTVSLIRDRVGVHLVVDADTGYGNALNVQRTMRMFERAGASAIQLEDQTYPKRCGHLADKGVIPAAEMTGKIKAALDARTRDTLVIARTDAAAVEGFERAIERARLYAEAGADLLFVEAPKTRDELKTVADALQGTVPLMANMVEGGRTPLTGASELDTLGFSLVIFPGAIVRVVARAAQDFYRTLHVHGTSAPFASRMFDFDALNAVIGTPEMLALGRAYEPDGEP
ncbi:isocitrate lyase/PEP mutase family protein [Salinarimonas soli]|uniref:Isocitrate lyase/PEP mutase family protein n=1 Tax=Salinarimonas soli TaxID=1638099 RepID=A0A5B2V1M2_9HYPH|nr:isocitrate lyase/PEP mutase family protein [Salinarimonas soli]KAA2232470.1 isocitrate lyase/PEP mutase family protein [Salinarimonas soli]